MPRGGNNKKPIALHQLHGSFRKDRHGPGEELERRIVSLEYNRCNFCGHRFNGTEWYIGDPTEQSFICADCLRGSVDLLRDRGVDVLAEDVVLSEKGTTG